MNDLKWIGKSMLLGLAFFLAVFLVKPVGVSTQFSVLSGIVHNIVDSDLIVEDSGRDSGYRSTNAYFDKDEGKLAKSIENPLNYSFIFVLAIPLGAFLSSRLRRRKANGADQPFAVGPDNDFKEKQSFTQKYLPGFLAGFLILFGARMAGGCTSGHMMSGIMQGSVSGFVFTAAVFGIAIPVSIMTTKRSMRRM